MTGHFQTTVDVRAPRVNFGTTIIQLHMSRLADICTIPGISSHIYAYDTHIWFPVTPESDEKVQLDISSMFETIENF